MVDLSPLSSDASPDQDPQYIYRQVSLKLRSIQPCSMPVTGLDILALTDNLGHILQVVQDLDDIVNSL